MQAIDEAGRATADLHGIIFMGAMRDEEKFLLKFNFWRLDGGQQAPLDLVGKGFDLWVERPGAVAAAVAEAVAANKKRVMS